MENNRRTLEWEGRTCQIEKDGITFEIRQGELPGGAGVLACEQTQEEVYLPDEIEGEPVRWTAPYAFSRTNVTEVSLPRYMEQVGNYVFYRCFRLRKLRCSDALSDIGSGAFIGSGIRELELDLYQGEQSSLKFIVDEIRFKLLVTLHYYREDGSVETAKVIFPEHYEDAVENTPARIVATRYYGSGGEYRQCFYNRTLNYKEYDQLFPRAVVAESEKTAVEIAALRLAYPYELQDTAKEQYQAYLKEHMEEAGVVYVEKEDMEMLRFFGREQLWSKQGMERAIDAASELKKTEILSTLMEEQHRLFPKKKKVFEL